jgi:hypothetical protein
MAFIRKVIKIDRHVKEGLRTRTIHHLTSQIGSPFSILVEMKMKKSE